MNEIREEKRKPYFYTGRGACILVTLILSAMMVWLSASIMNVALPAIEGQLNATLNELQWTVNIFTLCGGLIIVSGRLADAFGRKKLLITGAVVFMVGATLGGFANNITTLILARAIQGIGGAMILPASLALVEVSFHPPHRTIAIGLWIGWAWFAMAVGPAVGGVATEYLSWRWTMWVTVIPAAFVVIAGVLSLKESKNKAESPHIDYLGAIVIMLSMTLITYAAIESGITGWFETVTVTTLILGIVLAAFIPLIEKLSKSPVLAIKLLADRTFNGANLINIVSNIAFASLLFFSSIFLEIVEGYSPLATGLLLLPATISILVTLNAGSLIYNRVGAKLPTSLGMLMVSLGLLVIGLTSNGIGYSGLIGPFIVIGLGIGLFASPITAAALAAASHDDAGRAAGLFKASSMISAAIGVAIAGSTYQLYAYSSVRESFPSISKDGMQLLERIIGGDESKMIELQDILPEQYEQVMQTTYGIISSSYTFTIFALCLLCFAGTVAAFILIPRKHHFFAAASSAADISSHQPRTKPSTYNPMDRPWREKPTPKPRPRDEDEGN